MSEPVMLALKILGAWLALSLICAPVLIPILARHFRENYRPY